jgi:acyl-CoA thioesterase FadM
VPTDTELVVEGRILDESEKNVHIGLSIMNAGGVVLAEGESNYAMADLAIIADISGSKEEDLRKFLAKYPISE